MTETLRHIDRRLLGLFLLFIGVIIGTLSVRLGVQEPEISALKASIARLENEVEQQKASPHDTLSGQVYQANATDLLRFREHLRHRKELDQLIAELYRVADDSKLSISGIQYRPKPLPDFDLYHYQVSFSVEGAYRQLRELIHHLEYSEQILGVKSVQMAEASQETQVKLSLVVDTYFRTDRP